MGIKSPPRKYPPPAPPPHAWRNFARVRALDVACPACGVVSACRLTDLQGYAPSTGVWQCRECDRVWYVGVLLWARGKGARLTPADQVPTMAEALALREALGYATEEVLRGGRGARANRVCSCATGCPMHSPKEVPE